MLEQIVRINYLLLALVDVEFIHRSTDPIFNKEDVFIIRSASNDTVPCVGCKFAHLATLDIQQSNSSIWTSTVFRYGQVFGAAPYKIAGLLESRYFRSFKILDVRTGGVYVERNRSGPQ